MFFQNDKHLVLNGHQFQKLVLVRVLLAQTSMYMLDNQPLICHTKRVIQRSDFQGNQQLLRIIYITFIPEQFILSLIYNIIIVLFHSTNITFH